MWQTDLKEDDKIVSIRVLWLKWQFHFYYHMIVGVFLIHSCDFNVWSGRAMICNISSFLIYQVKGTEQNAVFKMLF